MRKNFTKEINFKHLRKRYNEIKPFGTEVVRKSMTVRNIVNQREHLAQLKSDERHARHTRVD